MIFRTGSPLGSNDEDAGCRAKRHFHNPWKGCAVSGVLNLAETPGLAMFSDTKGSG